MPDTQEPSIQAVLRSWCAARFVALKSLWTIAISGGAGGALDYIQSSMAHNSFSLARVDWHQLAMSAGGTALIAVLYHWKTPPASEIPK